MRRTLRLQLLGFLILTMFNGTSLQPLVYDKISLHPENMLQIFFDMLICMLLCLILFWNRMLLYRFMCFFVFFLKFS